MLDAVAPSQTIAYSYGNSSWTDLLTSYNGQNIAYDAIGNPTSYLGYTLKWNGRQLSSLSGNGTTASYKYDADGLRSYKKVGNTETTYQYVGDKLMYEKRGTTEFFYYYNSFGNLAGIKYYVNGTRYMVYALCNTRGDVEDLYWGSGNLACHYTYDSWGNVISVTDINGNEITSATHIGLMNPIRYRGYYYDSEIGMYYLQSRYYNPQVGRFINSDSIVDNRGLITQNLFQYCGNNPFNCSDPGGHLFGAIAVVGLLLVGTAALLSGCASSKNPSATVTKGTTSGTKRKPQPSTTTKGQSYTQQQKSYAATVYAEAGGVNKRTKQAVAHVMNNRIGTRSSWNSIEDVISAPHQFNGYENSMYKDAMDYYNKGICDNSIDKAAMDECMSVIIPIITGDESDITGGALYFHSFSNASDWPHHDDYTLVEVSGTEKFWFYK